MEAQQVQERKIPTVVGMEATAITPATATPTAMERDRTRQLTSETEQTITSIAPFFSLRSHATADCWELDKKKSKRPDNQSTLLE